MLAREAVLKALDASGVEAHLVPAYKGQTDTRPSPGIWYAHVNDLIPVAAAMTAEIGKEAWDELMKTAQVDNAKSGRVLYFPGEKLT